MTKRIARLIVHALTMPDGTERQIRCTGRRAWALDELIEAGEAGCTPIDHPGPRLSGYVHGRRGGRDR